MGVTIKERTVANDRPNIMQTALLGKAPRDHASFHVLRPAGRASQNQRIISDARRSRVLRNLLPSGMRFVLSARTYDAF